MICIVSVYWPIWFYEQKSACFHEQKLFCDSQTNSPYSELKVFSRYGSYFQKNDDRNNQIFIQGTHFKCLNIYRLSGKRHCFERHNINPWAKSILNSWICIFYKFLFRKRTREREKVWIGYSPDTILK